jgi:hypothetical protein
MIESPLIKELLAQRSHRDILVILDDRFGTIPEEVKAQLKAIQDDDRLHQLVRLAARCPDLDSFRHELDS